MQKWEEYVYKEYIQADNEFVENYIPFRSIDLSSYGLISDATGYNIVDRNGEMEILASVGGFSELMKAMRKMPGGKSGIKRGDAFECMKQFAKIWQEKIKNAGKWEKLIQKAKEQGETIPFEKWALRYKEREKSKNIFDILRNIFRR
jgi:hypothetical protein